MGELSKTPYYLTPLARQAIIDQYKRNLSFWAEMKKEATTPQLRQAIDHECELLSIQLQHYADDSNA